MYYTECFSHMFILYDYSYRSAIGNMTRVLQQLFQLIYLDS